jgi:hypothetical protein
MDYIIYQQPTGEITQSGACDYTDLLVGGGTVLENVVGTNSTHYVLNGIVTEYTEAQKAAKAARPTTPSVWSNDTFSWVDVSTLEEKVAVYSVVVQTTLDTFAQTWGYDSILSAASYVQSTNSRFRAEGQALLNWRDATWAWAETFVAGVTAKTTQPPTSDVQLISLMPTPPARPT